MELSSKSKPLLCIGAELQCVTAENVVGCELEFVYFFFERNR